MMRRWRIGALGLLSILILGAAAFVLLNTSGNGPLLHAATVPYTLRSVVLDEPTHRIFVAGLQNPAPRNPLPGTLISVFDAGSGSLLHTTVLGFTATPPVVDRRSGHVLVVSDRALGGTTPAPGQSALYILDGHSGAVLRGIPLRSPGGRALRLTSPALIVDSKRGRAYINAGATITNAIPSRLAVLDTTTGTVLRTIGLHIPPGPLAFDGDSGRVFETSGALDSVAVVDPASASVHVVHVRAGLAVQAVDGRANTLVLSPLAAQPGSAYVALMHITNSTIHTIRVASNPGAAVVDPALARAYVVCQGRFFGPPGGTVTTIDLNSGRIVHTAPAGTRVGALAIDVKRGRLFVADQGLDAQHAGSVLVLDAASGRVLHTLAIGGHPNSMVVDPSTGHLIALGTGVPPAPRRNVLAQAVDDIRHALGRSTPEPLVSPVPAGSLIAPQGTVMVLDAGD